MSTLKLFRISIVFFALLLICTWSHANDTEIDLSNPCFFGINPTENYLSVSDEYREALQNGVKRALVPAPVSNWFEKHHWNKAFNYWRVSQTCSTGAEILINDSTDLCRLAEAPIPNTEESICADKTASIGYLAMHKHLLQSFKTLWPQASDTVSSWHRFPLSSEDFPEIEAHFFRTWPEEVIQNAKLIDTLGMMKHEELLKRWPSEKDFAHWLVCGDGESGHSKNSLDGALATNILPLSTDANQTTLNNLDHLVFWKNIAWLERAWDRYRMRIGKTPYEPELQHTVLKQCLSLEYWINFASKTTNINKQSNGELFNKGRLNPERSGEVIRTLGKIIDIKKNDQGQIYIKMRLNTRGIQPIWISSGKNFSERGIRIGDAYVVIGSIARPNKETRKFLNDSDVMLIAETIQSPK